MRISIITPNYNSIRFISETWKSVHNQTHQNWEWLIIDDGSTDDSLSKIHSFSSTDSRIKVFERKQLPKGASTCRNIGITAATGDFIMFLDADDLLAPWCLENRINQIKKHPILDFGVFNMGMFERKIKSSDVAINKYTDADEDYLVLFLTYQLPWPITAPLWRRSFIQKNNIRFSENYQRLQDPEFHSKILLCHDSKFRVFKESRPDCFYRQPNKGLNKPNIHSLKKTTDSILLYYKEIYFLLKQFKPEYIHYLDNFTNNIFHSLLFYSKLASIRPITQLYREMKKIHSGSIISMAEIRLFAFFNLVGLTFIKGAGVSRLWKYLISKSKP